MKVAEQRSGGGELVHLATGGQVDGYGQGIDPCCPVGADLDGVDVSDGLDCPGELDVDRAGVALRPGEVLCGRV